MSKHISNPHGTQPLKHGDTTRAHLAEQPQLEEHRRTLVEARAQQRRLGIHANREVVTHQEGGAVFGDGAVESPAVQELDTHLMARERRMGGHGGQLSIAREM